MNWYKKAKSGLSDEDFAEITKSKWIDVDSSFIDKIAYYEPLEILDILLKSGKEYSFKNVPKKIFDAFRRSGSKGQYFNKVIKKRYKTR